jgi:uncharacterized protein
VGKGALFAPCPPLGFMVGTPFRLCPPYDAETLMNSTDRSDSVDPKLLEILVCPLTKGPLEFDATKQELISRSAKLAYPIRDGIPIMLPEEARKIE